MSSCGSYSLANKKFGFIGTGAMNGSIIRSIIQQSNPMIQPQQVFAYDPNVEFLNKIVQETNIQKCSNNDEMIHTCDVIILGVKPQSLESVLKEASTAFGKKKSDLLLISIAAGYKISTIYEHLAQIAQTNERTLDEFFSVIRVARVMPNICCTVEESASAFVLGKPPFGASKHITLDTMENDRSVVHMIFSMIGECVSLSDESYLDAVTGLSGSGPAFAFMFIEALAEAGVYCGLGRETSNILAAQTVLGAAKMVLKEKVSPAVLKDRVVSLFFRNNVSSFSSTKSSPSFQQIARHNI
nr:unnamed protein product [Naegleria fowleri]